MKTRNTLFDSIKGFAILSIMFIHLGQWNLDLQEGSRLAIIRSSGLLGVELTYLINAFFLTKHYKEQSSQICAGGGYVIKCLLKIVPIYWLSLIICWISGIVSGAEIKGDFFNCISHFLFLNGLTPTWWAGFMGGTGYFGVLAIMWVIFPLYLKRVNNLKQSLLYGVIIISLSYLIMQFVKILNSVIIIDTTNNLGDWLYYIFRGIYCYSIGCILYYVVKTKLTQRVTSSNIDHIAGVLLLLYILLKMAGQGDLFDGILFTGLWCVFICIALNTRIFIIDNIIFSFLGRNITELFVSHIVLYYVLVEHFNVMMACSKTMIVLFVLSIAIAPLLKAIVSNPFANLINKVSA